MATETSASPMEPEGTMGKPSEAQLAPPGPRAWIALGMLCVVYVLNFLSRQLPSILAKPIQDSLHVTDGQLGRIGGLYFALFYCCISIPVGWLADKTNRSRVLAIACAVWSAATMCCGGAGSYLQFAVAYMTVGFGEAGGVPPSYSIISDYFPPGRRGRALGFYNIGPPIGAALGIAFGASIAAAFSWRYAFVVLGAVGLIAVIGILFLVPEPRRGGLDRISDHVTARKTGFRQTLMMFISRPSLMLTALACGANQFITYGLINFAVLFLMREKHMRLNQVAVYYALVVAIGMGGGILASGRVIDRLTQRSKQAYALVPATSLTLALPFYLAFVWAPSWHLALLFLTGTMFLNYFYLTSAVTLVQEEVRPDQRVMSGALLLLIMNLIGLGLGPTFVGAASDFFRANHPHHSLQIALYLLAPLYVVAISLFLALAHVLRNENRVLGETVS
ncbi:MAG TPA: MFS transporter [Acidobacteriaceae bacterium]|jgi:predicted MFS family arabinose efflux permease|nr:MFS transporter [Acidobacteriaceae bacterium]